MGKSLLIHPEELSRRWIDRMAALGVDMLVLHPVGGVRAAQSLCDLLDKLAHPDFRALIDYAIDQAGLQIGYAMHAASYLIPRTYFDVHPDWFRMDGAGKRVCETNFCASNPDALTFFAARAVELADRLYRSAPVYYIWLDDSQSTCCHCPDCRGLSESDQQLKILNAVLDALRQNVPDARLAYLAYLRTLTTPKVVKPHPGIFLQYAPIARDPAKPLSECDPGYFANLQDLLAYFGANDAQALEYWFDNSKLSRWQKPPRPFVPDNARIRADIADYRALGFRDIASFACYLGADYEALYGEADISAFGY